MVVVPPPPTQSTQVRATLLNIEPEVAVPNEKLKLGWSLSHLAFIRILKPRPPRKLNPQSKAPAASYF